MCRYCVQLPSYGVNRRFSLLDLINSSSYFAGKGLEGRGLVRPKDDSEGSSYPLRRVLRVDKLSKGKQFFGYSEQGGIRLVVGQRR